MTQYGLLKKWRITPGGTFVDGKRVSEITVSDLGINGKHSFTVRVGVKADAANQGGLNLFGRKFGNYDQDILLRLDYEPRRT